MQLASKMRFVSAQLEALLAGDLWLRIARRTPTRWPPAWPPRSSDIDGVEIAHPVEANGVFARLPRPAIDRLLAELAGRGPLLRLGRGHGRGALDVLVGHDGGRRGRVRGERRDAVADG